MDVRQLEILRELRDRGSVSAAADALRLTPSAVSQQLSALQRASGAQLTHKVGRTIQLTEAGRAVAGRADAALRALAEVEQILTEAGTGSERPVTVSAFHSAAKAWFPALVALDGVDVHCRDLDVPRERFLTLPGEIDVVIAHRSVHTDPWPPPLHVQSLLVEPFDIALGADHPLAGRPLSGTDLAALTWISFHEDFPLSRSLDVLAAEAGHPLRIAHRINDYAVCEELLRTSDLACLLPRFTTASSTGIVLHPTPGRAPARRIDALCRPDRLARPGVQAVLATLADGARELVAARSEHPRPQTGPQGLPVGAEASA